MQKIKISFSVVAFLFASTTLTNAQVSNFTEGFETVLPSGWAAFNKSTPANTSITWAQGNNANFNSFDGSSNAYAASNFECIAENPGVGTLSNWLLTPVLSLNNNATLKFYTRKTTPDPFDFPDRLEIRLSKNGSSTNVGSDATSVGDFTSLYATVNQSLAEGGYPYEWKEYTIVLTGISAGQTGRIAFRHYVTDAGINGANSDLIGIDNVRFDNLLPVQLVNFSAAIQNNKPLLQWTVTNEQQMLGYDIERSIDGISFSAAGFIAAKNSGNITQYNFTDFNAISGKSFYRLKQKDKDGTITYSEIKSVETIVKNAWKLLNNTPGAKLQIQLSLSESAAVSLQLFTVAGTEVFRQQYGILNTGTTTLDIYKNMKTAGIYYLKVTIGQETSSIKVIR